MCQDKKEVDVTQKHPATPRMESCSAEAVLMSWWPKAQCLAVDEKAVVIMALKCFCLKIET